MYQTGIPASRASEAVTSKDQQHRAALGHVTMCHVRLDHILRLTIRTLSGATHQEAMAATAFDGSHNLCNRIEKLAKSRLGESLALIRLQGLVERCRRATELRNDVTHAVSFHGRDEEILTRTDGRESKPLPTVKELEALAGALFHLAREINTARRKGFLAEALADKK